MGEREFLIYLDEAQENRYRHWHISESGQIKRFRIQYEAFISRKWCAIVRYDTAHDMPHKDILHPNGTQTKEIYPDYDNAAVLTFGQLDIVNNWPAHRARYEKEMGE